MPKTYKRKMYEHKTYPIHMYKAGLTLFLWL